MKSQVRSPSAREAYRISRGTACVTSDPNFESAWESKTRPSFCHVWKRIWIGNIDAGLGIAARKISGFAGVFDCSGIESRGISLAPCFESAKVAFDSLADADTGLALADAAFETDEIGSIAERRSRAAIETPPFEILVGKSVRRMCVPPLNTEVAFDHFMKTGAGKIARLLDEIGPSDRLLVFCIGGINRSAAAIVSYLMTRENVSAIDAVSVVRTAALVGRDGTNVLTNSDFVLFFLSEKLFANDISESKAKFNAQLRAATIPSRYRRCRICDVRMRRSRRSRASRADTRVCTPSQCEFRQSNIGVRRRVLLKISASRLALSFLFFFFFFSSSDKSSERQCSKR